MGLADAPPVSLAAALISDSAGAPDRLHAVTLMAMEQPLRGVLPAPIPSAARQMSALWHHACVRMTHDHEANAAYIYLVDAIDRGEVARSCVADIAMDNAAITIDFDAEGRVLGIEVLGASQALRAETIRAAEDITRGT